MNLGIHPVKDTSVRSFAAEEKKVAFEGGVGMGGAESWYSDANSLWMQPPKDETLELGEHENSPKENLKHVKYLLLLGWSKRQGARFCSWVPTIHSAHHLYVNIVCVVYENTRSFCIIQQNVGASGAVCASVLFYTHLQGHKSPFSVNIITSLLFHHDQSI